MTLKFELGRYFFDSGPIIKFHHHMYNRLEVIVLTNKHKQADNAENIHLALLCYAGGQLQQTDELTDGQTKLHTAEEFINKLNNSMISNSFFGMVTYTLQTRSKCLVIQNIHRHVSYTLQRLSKTGYQVLLQKQTAGKTYAEEVGSSIFSR